MEKDRVGEEIVASGRTPPICTSQVARLSATDWYAKQAGSKHFFFAYADRTAGRRINDSIQIKSPSASEAQVYSRVRLLTQA